MVRSSSLIRIAVTFIAVLLLFTSVTFGSGNESPGDVPPPVEVKAEAAVLLDARSGEVLFELEPDKRWPPASLVKIMTLRLAFKALAEGDLDPKDQVVVSEKAWRTPGSRMFLNVGSKVSLDQLLMGIAVASGNDATVALAERMAGSEEAFVELMNREAARLGLKNTKFADSNGLSAKGQYMSARDAAMLGMAYIRDFPQALKLHSTTELTFNNIKQYNRNGLIRGYEGADGLKTGHIEEAGYNLVATAQRGNMRLIAVVLGAGSEMGREEEAAKLLDWGFLNFRTVDVARSGQELERFKVWKGRRNWVSVTPESDLVVTVPKETGALTTTVKQTRRVIAPVERGEALGEVRVLMGDEQLASKKVIAAHGVERGGFFKRLWDSIRLLFLGAFKMD